MPKQLNNSSLFSDTNNLISIDVLENSQDLSKNLLARFADRFNFNELVQSVFNNGTDINRFQSDWRTRNFVLPEIEVVSSQQINGANGAFSSQTGKIYLAEEFLLANQSDTEAVAKVIIEEYGHYVDSQVNSSDTPGDEGVIFAALVLGEELGEDRFSELREEDDSAVVVIDGEEIRIEQKVLGFDNRRVVENTEGAAAAIGLIRVKLPNGKTVKGTGTLISPYHVLTAAHNVYGRKRGDSQEDWESNNEDVTISFGQNNTARPFGTARVSDIRIFSDWTSDNNWILKESSSEDKWRSKSQEDDIALLTLDRNIGSFTEFFDYDTIFNNDGLIRDGFIGEQTVNTAGYPGNGEKLNFLSEPFGVFD